MASSPITDDIVAALDRHALRPRRLLALSPPTTRKRGRCLYRVDLEDRRTIKARRLESAEAAAELSALRAGIDPAFTPVIARHGPVLLEAWIDGTLLTDLDPDARAAEAGALLARLHGTPAAAASTRAWRERAATELATVAAAGALDAGEAAAIAAALARHDPGSALTVLAHRDFCAENMVIDAGGRLHVVDNEWLTVAPAGLDLGHTFSRWPMSADAWGRFLHAYRSASPGDPGPLAFWKIVAALTSARIRLAKAPARLAVPLGLLRRFAAEPGDTLRDPP